MFKRFIDDGFGITEANKEEFAFWIHEFNLLRETITIDKFKYRNAVDFMDLYVFKGVRFFEDGNLDISVYQKEENNCDMDEIEGSNDKQNLNIDEDG